MSPRSYCRSAATATGLVVLLFTSLSASASEDDVAAPLAADDECAAAADGESPASCALTALQLRALQQEERREQEKEDLPESEMSLLLREDDSSSQTSCTNFPGCATILAFNAEFDTNDPNTMQRAMDEYTEWKWRTQGIKVAVTQSHYYEMYHTNVGSKLGMYMPQGLFSWKFGDQYNLLWTNHANKAVIARDGTVTFNMGWWRRNMFWNACVKSLPNGKKFDFSNVKDFNDCKNCPAKLEYTVTRGGLSGKEGDVWKITDLKLIKLK